MVCQLGSPEWSQSSVHGTRSQQVIATLGRRVPLFLDAQAAEELNAWMPRERRALTRAALTGIFVREN